MPAQTEPQSTSRLPPSPSQWSLIPPAPPPSAPLSRSVVFPVAIAASGFACLLLAVIVGRAVCRKWGSNLQRGGLRAIKGSRGDSIASRLPSQAGDKCSRPRGSRTQSRQTPEVEMPPNKDEPPTLITSLQMHRGSGKDEISFAGYGDTCDASAWHGLEVSESDVVSCRGVGPCAAPATLEETQEKRTSSDGSAERVGILHVADDTLLSPSITLQVLHDDFSSE